MEQSSRDFRKLQVWQRSHALALEIYRVRKGFPSDERFGLTSQVRRSAASIPALIAEGCGRGTNKDFARYMRMSQGSASEADYHILIARDLGYAQAKIAEKLMAEAQAIGRMLQGYRTKLKC